MKPERTYGTLSLANSRGSAAQKWVMRAEPHVIQTAKRLWKGGSRDAGLLMLDATPSVAVDLEWFLQRYPLVASPLDRRRLQMAASGQRDLGDRVHAYMAGYKAPLSFPLALPPRQYQAKEASIVLEQGHLLVADEVGLGKTCSSISVMTDKRSLPAVVVTLTHLPRQWAREIRKFAPWLTTHILKNGPVYALDGSDGRPRGLTALPDVVVTSYSKLDKWQSVLAQYARYVVFDEIQELRRTGSNKYAAAVNLAHSTRMGYRVGLSATPLFNYGDEIWSVFNVLAPGVLGSRAEFVTEWCVPVRNDNWKIRNPSAFGTWARDQGLMVRHTRQEVGRELPKVITAVQQIGAEAHYLAEIEERAAELAEILLGGEKRGRGEALMAGGELDALVRRATGLAKAPYVAEFVRLLVESGEAVLLAGWHHDVYDAWEERLTAAGVRVARYTGKEDPKHKDAAAVAFIEGKVDVLMISLRAGAGLDGLQTASRVVVFGELDWSPGVMEQVVGRLSRDGQNDPVVAYYLMADSGSDPLMNQVLGVKRQQSIGVVDPLRPKDEIFGTVDVDRTRQLAEMWLRKKGRKVVAHE